MKDEGQFVLMEQKNISVFRELKPCYPFLEINTGRSFSPQLRHFSGACDVFYYSFEFAPHFNVATIADLCSLTEGGAVTTPQKSS